MLDSINEQTPGEEVSMRARLRHLSRCATLPILLVSLAASLAVTASAGARTYFVSGQQIPGDAASTMRGGLVGTWTTTSVVAITAPIPEHPLVYQLIGAERFDGCLNRHRDWSCRHDPKGTLTFYMDTWLEDSVPDPDVFSGVWGACVHPVTAGTGAFAGAQGVITMIDTYAPGGVYVGTRYDGNIILPDPGGVAAPPQTLSGSASDSGTRPAARSAAVLHAGCGSA
jgi:hypothetical protein